MSGEKLLKSLHPDEGCNTTATPGLKALIKQLEHQAVQLRTASMYGMSNAHGEQSLDREVASLRKAETREAEKAEKRIRAADADKRQQHHEHACGDREKPAHGRRAQHPRASAPRLVR